MRILSALLAASTLVMLAAPAHAEPGESTDAAFLGSLRSAGITYSDPGQVISAAQSVCGLISGGESGLQLLSDLKHHNPAISTDGAAQFAALSARFYCPQQLTSAS